MKDVLYIFRFVKPYKTSLISLIVFLLFYNIMSTALPYLTFTVIIDDFLPNHDFKSIYFVISIIVLIVIMMAVIDFFVG